MAIAKLDRNSPLPLWAQLETDLRLRLDSGEFVEQFPTDQLLTEQYDVSRHTVREAVRHLNKSGLLRRERGRGTVVDRAEFEQSLGTLYSLFQTIEAAGVEQTSEVVSLEVVTDSVAAGHLDLDEDADLVHLERVRLAGGSPLAVDRAWLPYDVGVQLLDLDFTHTALYDELERVGVGRPDDGWERLTPRLPAAEDRDRLGLKKSDCVFFLERLGRRNGRPIEWRNTVLRGDRYRFVVDWSAGSASALRPSAVD